jgi:hypothetical protein
MSNTADVKGGKPIDVWSQSISGVNTINPLVAFYDNLNDNIYNIHFKITNYRKTYTKLLIWIDIIKLLNWILGLFDFIKVFIKFD